MPCSMFHELKNGENHLSIVCMFVFICIYVEYNVYILFWYMSVSILAVICLNFTLNHTIIHLSSLVKLILSVQIWISFIIGFFFLYLRNIEGKSPPRWKYSERLNHLPSFLRSIVFVLCETDIMVRWCLSITVFVSLFKVPSLNEKQP